jgi:hypothetical protein
MGAVRASIPSGIPADQLADDIEMLLKGEHTTAEELRSICNAIEATTNALSDLDKLVKKHLPHKTAGSCHGLGVIGKNNLLSMLFDIQSSSIQFCGRINQVNNRVDNILK